jgi:hypothetical protein
MPRDIGAVFADIELVVGLPTGALMNQEIADPYSRLDAYGNAIWVAEPFHTAVHYARHGSELIEHKLRAALELRYAWRRWGEEAERFSAAYWAQHPFRPVVLALDIPLIRLDWYRDQPDPAKAWRKTHRNPHLREVNYPLEPPVPIAWVVAAIDPDGVAQIDREMQLPPDMSETGID